MTFDWEWYKRSDKWKLLKESANLRSGYQCQCMEDCEEERCGNTLLLEMHHDRYPSCPGLDTIENVRMLCRECHESFHTQYTILDLKLAEYSDLRTRIASGFCNHPKRMTDDELCAFLNNTTIRRFYK